LDDASEIAIAPPIERPQTTWSIDFAVSDEFEHSLGVFTDRFASYFPGRMSGEVCRQSKRRTR